MKRHNRMIEEKEKLDIKIEETRSFIWDWGNGFDELPMVDADLLLTQHYIMRQYSEILGKRIARA